MECIHADEVLEMIPLWSYADMKKETQKSIDKHYKRLSKLNRESSVRTMTPEELAYRIARKQLDGK